MEAAVQSRTASSPGVSQEMLASIVHRPRRQRRVAGWRTQLHAHPARPDPRQDLLGHRHLRPPDPLPAANRQPLPEHPQPVRGHGHRGRRRPHHRVRPHRARTTRRELDPDASRQGLVPDPAHLRPTGSLVRQDLATRGESNPPTDTATSCDHHPRRLGCVRPSGVACRAGGRRSCRRGKPVLGDHVVLDWKAPHAAADPKAAVARARWSSPVLLRCRGLEHPRTPTARLLLPRLRKRVDLGLRPVGTPALHEVMPMHHVVVRWIAWRWAIGPGQERLSPAGRLSPTPAHGRGAVPVVVPSPAHVTEPVLRHTALGRCSRDGLHATVCRHRFLSVRSICLASWSTGPRRPDR